MMLLQSTHWTSIVCVTVAGDALAKIETDKAAIDFEAQDDGVVAKILISASDGSDIPVGTPIMITVEDPADVAAFQDYVVPATVVKAPAVVEAPTAATTAVATPLPVVPLPAAPVVVAPPPLSPPPVATPAPTSMSATISSSSSSFSTALPGMTYMNTKKSPLTYTLNKEQTNYVELYGTTGQSPIS